MMIIAIWRVRKRFSLGLGLNALDSVADLGSLDDVHALDYPAEIGVLAGKVRATVGVFADKKLGVVVDALVGTPSYSKTACLEGNVVVLGLHLAAAGTVTLRVTTLDNHLVDAVDGETLVVIGADFLEKVGDGVGSLIGKEFQGDIAAVSGKH